MDICPLRVIILDIYPLLHTIGQLRACPTITHFKYIIDRSRVKPRQTTLIVMDIHPLRAIHGDIYHILTTLGCALPADNRAYTSQTIAHD
jgi:hypothetical protein